jgi:hypothetical protein
MAVVCGGGDGGGWDGWWARRGYVEIQELDHNKGETKGYSSESSGCRGCKMQTR